MAGNFNVKLWYDRDSVAWLSNHIEQKRPILKQLQGTDRERIVALFGAFLGECLIRAYGGKWKRTDYGLGVDFGNITAFPFTKVEKHIDEEDSEVRLNSIIGFFRGTEGVLKNQDILT